MIEFYPQIKQFHVFVALLSGTLFALRGAFALAGARWPQALPVKLSLPLGFFVFPTMLIVIMVPVGIRIYRVILDR